MGCLFALNTEPYHNSSAPSTSEDFMQLRLAAITALCLTTPAMAQECLSIPSIQQKLMAVMTIGGSAEADRRRMEETARLIAALTTAPPGVNDCWKRVK